MMLALGFFVFERRTLPYQTFKHDASYSWNSNNRIGTRDAYQYLGQGQEKINLTGDLYPEITGGKVTLALLRQMAELGLSWPLLDGNGTIYGMFVISNVTETGSELLPDGSPRKISFTVELIRVDEQLAVTAKNAGTQISELVSNMTGAN